MVNFNLRFPPSPTRIYVFEASTNVLPWMPISTNFANSNFIDFLDPAASNFPYRFYRGGEQP